jgi:uncharacterized protein
MQCPACRTVTLVMADRQGVEVDYCPQCRGVWLDRGELDKIIERTASLGFGSTPAPGPAPDPRGFYRRDDDDDDDYRRHPERRRKRGFLGELFDFD